MQYSKDLLDHFRNPRNQGRISDPDAIGEKGNIKCGDVMKLYLKVGETDEGEKYIADIKFETLGCAAAIAATSVLTELAKGKKFTEALAITKDDIVNVLGDIPPLKYHCSILAEEALKNAIVNYQNK
jgi:nitrogen fixation protein NifU and related proteins